MKVKSYVVGTIIGLCITVGIYAGVTWLAMSWVRNECAGQVQNDQRALRDRIEQLERAALALEARCGR